MAEEPQEYTDDFYRDEADRYFKEGNIEDAIIYYRLQLSQDSASPDQVDKFRRQLKKLKNKVPDKSASDYEMRLKKFVEFQIFFSTECRGSSDYDSDSEDDVVGVGKVSLKDREAQILLAAHAAYELGDLSRAKNEYSRIWQMSVYPQYRHEYYRALQYFREYATLLRVTENFKKNGFLDPIDHYYSAFALVKLPRKNSQEELADLRQASILFQLCIDTASKKLTSLEGATSQSGEELQKLINKSQLIQAEISKAIEKFLKTQAARKEKAVLEAKKPTSVIVVPQASTSSTLAQSMLSLFSRKPKDSKETSARVEIPKKVGPQTNQDYLVEPLSDDGLGPASSK